MFTLKELEKMSAEEVIDKLQHENYSLLEEDTIINELGDCFYYAKMRKVRE